MKTSIRLPLTDKVFFVSTINEMAYEFDPTKNASNITKHQGVPLADASYFEWDTSVVREDTRYGYPEKRFEAVGYIDDRLFVMIFCSRGDAVRVISLRRANRREEKRYAKT